MADEPLDYWPKPYERTGDTKDAMNEYLSWEVDLLPRIERDGTTRFSTPPYMSALSQRDKPPAGGSGGVIYRP